MQKEIRDKRYNSNILTFCRFESKKKINKFYLGIIK